MDHICFLHLGDIMEPEECNARIQEGRCKSAPEIVSFICKYVEDFKNAQERSKSGITGHQRRHKDNARWSLPPVGCLKINCNAALDLQAGKAGVGIIISDHEGKLVECAAFTQCVKLCSNAWNDGYF